MKFFLCLSREKKNIKMTNEFEGGDDDKKGFVRKLSHKIIKIIV